MVRSIDHVHGAATLSPPDPSSPSVLHQRIESLTAAVASRQQIGWVTGLLSGCLGLSAQQGWQLLVTLSQHTNTKVHRVAGLIETVRDGGPCSPADEALCAQLRDLLGSGWDQLMQLNPGATADPVASML